jgi:tetratricopeptide (TPR) repeat protein
MAKGHMGQGLEKIQEAQRAFLENEGRSLYATSEHLLGKLYLQIVENARPISLSTMAKNVGFLIRNVPFAGRKAEEHFNKAIQVAREIGARGIMAMAYLDLGLLHKAKKRRDQARECLIEAIKLFEQCGTEAHLKQAKEALASLE